jgi:hypothetical protein
MRNPLRIALFVAVLTLARIDVLNAQAVKPELGQTKVATADAGELSSDGWVVRAKRILEIGSEERTTADQKKQAYRELAALKPKPEDDARYLFAFVLIAMHEKQWPSAQKDVTSLLDQHENYVPARAAKARMLLTLDKKLAAIAELEILAKGIGAPAANVSPDQLSHAAQFLGLAIGYFEGPSKDSIKATTLQGLIDQTDKIPEELKVAFEKARRTVASEYHVLVDKGEKALEELRRDLTEDAQRKRSELESQRAKTEEDAEAAKREIESDWAKAKATWDTAWQKCQNLVQNVNALQIERSQLVNSLALLQKPNVNPNGNIDRLDEQRYLDAKRRIDAQITNVDLRINGFAAQYDIANRNGMLIESQMNAIRGRAQRLGMELAALNGSFANADKQIRTKEQLAQKADPKLSAGKLRQARAFSTYDDFNFHKEQALLVEALPGE